MTGDGDELGIELRGVRAERIRAAVVVLNGASRSDLDRGRALAATFSDGCMLVAVDGGLATCLSAGLAPDLWVGDGDSSGERPADIPAVSLPTDKNRSDLAAALDALRERRVVVVVVAGLVGGRLDHEWANLLELAAHADGFAALVAPTDRGSVLVTCRGCRLSTPRGRTFSLFSMGRGARVTLLGPRWELRDHELPPGSLGLSNETGDELNLTIHQGTAALIWDVDGT